MSYPHNAHFATGNLDPLPITAKEILGDTTGASLRRNLTPVMGRWTFGLFDCCKHARRHAAGVGPPHGSVF